MSKSLDRNWWRRRLGAVLIASLLGAPSVGRLGDAGVVVGPTVASAQATRPRNASPASATVGRAAFDSLQSVVAQLEARARADSAAAKVQATTRANRVAVASLFLWVILVIAYLWWAIWRYVVNHGLSDEEWFVLYPELYVKDATKRVEYQKRRQALLDHQHAERQRRMLVAAGQDEATATAENPTAATASSTVAVSTMADPSAISPIEEPKANPYENDSFGLPPGTIRGILALTVLVVFTVMQVANLQSPVFSEDDFKALSTATMMVLAFYFGSKAVDVLESRVGGAARLGETPGGQAPPTSPPPDGGVAARMPAPLTPGGADATMPLATAVESAGIDAAVMPVRFHEARLLAAGSVPTPFPAGGFLQALAAAMSPSRATVAPPPAAPVGAPTAAPPAAAAPPAGTAVQVARLELRILALTASFETSRGFPDCFGIVAGDFDGMGISFGALQWNIGQGSLQPLLRRMMALHRSVMMQALADRFDDIDDMLKLPKAAQLEWARGIQTISGTAPRRCIVLPEWRQRFRALGTTPEMIQLQTDAARDLLATARVWCDEYELTTERGLALMFDIRVQNGSLDKPGSGVGSRIRADFAALPTGLSAEQIQVERMKVIANRRAEISRAQFVADVRSRKLTIATGEGMVHGNLYDIEKQFGISVRRSL